MSVAQADLAKAINTVWDASTLDALFQALWTAGVVVAEFPVLHEGEAGAGQPFPYCICEIEIGNTSTRMSKATNDNWETRDIPVTFRIHTTDVDGDVRTAKEIAAYLAEEIMKVFGGHPTQVPTGVMALDNGNHLVTTYQNDYSLREGEDNYKWFLSYNFRLDIPVMHTDV